MPHNFAFARLTKLVPLRKYSNNPRNASLLIGLLSTVNHIPVRAPLVAVDNFAMVHFTIL